jgi:GTP cyclohydrolase II
LLDLGVSDMVLLSNSRRTVVGLEEGYGLRIVDQRPIPHDADEAGPTQPAPGPRSDPTDP